MVGGCEGGDKFILSYCVGCKAEMCKGMHDWYCVSCEGETDF